MPQVKDVMTQGCEWIAPDVPISKAAKIMKDKDIGFLPVGENDKLIGMVTDRDIVVRGIAAGKDPAKATARDVMTAKTYYCFDDQDVEEVCNNLGEIKVRRLPVVNREKRLVGVVTVGDLAQAATRANVGQTEQQITACIQDRKKQAA